MRILFFLLVCCAVTSSFAQTGFNGHFTANVDGVDCQLQLTTDRNALTGTYDEGAFHLQVSGTVNGKQASGELKDPASGTVVAAFQGVLHAENTLYLTFTTNGRTRSQPFQRMATPANPAASSAGKQTQDAQLVGTWSYQVITSSNGAGFQTVLYFQLGADGRYVQSSKSVGGSSEWSYNSGPAEVQQQGQWYSRENVLYLQIAGQRDYVAAAKYRFYEGKLVTEDVNGRKIWTRE